MTWHSTHNRATDARTERARRGQARPRQAPRVRRGWRVSGAAFGRLIPFALERAGDEPADVRRRDGWYRRLLAVADVLAAAIALAVCIPLAGNGDRLSAAAILGIPLIVVVAKLVGLYDRDELLLKKTTLEEAPALFQLATLSALLLWIGGDTLVTGQLGRDQVLVFWLMLFGLLVLARAAARALARRVAPTERVMLVGTPSGRDRARTKIETGPAVDAEVVAEIGFDDGLEASRAEAELPTVARQNEAHRVVVAPPSTDHGEVLSLIRAAKAQNLKVSVLPRMLEVVGSSVEFDDLEGVSVLGVPRFGLTRSSRTIKRTMDVLGSALILVLAAPALLLIALAIKLDSRGPVLFRQRRIGRDGRPFHMLKFRTMVRDAEAMKAALADRNEAEGLFKIAEDPRVTRVGRLLRKTSIDELPQLMNVLVGEMSLVGPRPLIDEDDKRVEGWYRRRLHLTPGMTGRWQVLGSARIPLDEMVTLDYMYVANWSLWGDVKILLRTLPYVVGRRGM
jgi:exopolysaccharide biosynthesis polyprenyl glycosylphosphotransferase